MNILWEIIMIILMNANDPWLFQKKDNLKLVAVRQRSRNSVNDMTDDNERHANIIWNAKQRRTEEGKRQLRNPTEHDFLFNAARLQKKKWLIIRVIFVIKLTIHFILPHNDTTLCTLIVVN